MATPQGTQHSPETHELSPAPERLIIGICGAKRAGKNTLADTLSLYLGLAHLSFAGPLRSCVADILGMDMATLEAEKEVPISWLDGVTPRQMMQTMGTEWGRTMVHPELWLRALLRRIPPTGAIISDVRFENEAKLIKDHGGVLIRVTRTGTGAGDAHISETPVPEQYVDYTVANNGTPAEMVDRVLTYIEGVFA